MICHWWFIAYTNSGSVLLSPRGQKINQRSCNYRGGWSGDIYGSCVVRRWHGLLLLRYGDLLWNAQTTEFCRYIFVSFHESRIFRGVGRHAFIHSTWCWLTGDHCADLVHDSTSPCWSKAHSRSMNVVKICLKKKTQRLWNILERTVVSVAVKCENAWK